VPELLDNELRMRLRRRYGSAIDAWLDALPTVLADLGERWSLEWLEVIRRGSMSVAIRCRATDGTDAVLKLAPDRRRIADEAAALERWRTPHVPALLAAEPQLGALLLEGSIRARR